MKRKGWTFQADLAVIIKQSCEQLSCYGPLRIPEDEGAEKTPSGLRVEQFRKETSIVFGSTR